jgi:hypothetical protein
MVAAVGMSSPKPSKERDLMAMKAAMSAESIARRRSHRGIIQSASSLGSSGSVSDKQVEPAGHPIVEFAPMRNCLVKRVKTTRVLVTVVACQVWALLAKEASWSVRRVVSAAL